MTEKRIYKPLDELSNDEINEIMARNELDELRSLPFSVGMYHPNWKYAQDLCIKLSQHEDAALRANAVLGLAYVARTKAHLEKHLVKPVLLRELRENPEYRWRINDAIGDINLFLKWKIGDKAIKED
ncbi:hypothetical protein [Paenibacillus kobensis]|uniref:hypothetical protein n=1 Tax=Paenibacillus kobensis TaxID=59841 RepID=UPI001FEBE906|nr:hypothetical protein [Paenibacillus kobensis]